MLFPIKKLFDYFILFLALISLIGGITYRLYALNNLGIFFSASIAVIVFVIILFINEKGNKNDLIKFDKNVSFITSFTFLIPYFFFIFCAFYLLFKEKTVNSIISPWESIDYSFFIFYFTATLILLFHILKNKAWPIFLISIHCLLSFLVATIVYKIGFGYDIFIHEATLNLIDKTGTVFPKPNYYVSFYSLILIFHKLFFIPIYLLNKFLVPVLAAALIPASLYFSFKNILSEKKNLLLSILFLLILPFSIFTLSTPQNFAYLFLILEIIYCASYKDKKDLIVIFSLAFAALLAQPIAGIPAFMFFVIFSIYQNNYKLKNFFISFLNLATAFSLPFAFLFFEKSYGNPYEVNKLDFNYFLSLFRFSFPGQENFILNSIYLYAFNIKFIICLICAAGLYFAWKEKEKYKDLFIFPAMSFSLLFSYFLCKYLPFNFLISYEVSDFTERILIVSVLFLIPYILLAIYTFLKKLEEQNKIVKISVFFFIAVLLTTSFYVSYPRQDRYFNSRGYSVGENDIAAVRWINDNAKVDYIVLANQQVSAAALSQYGFNKYYKDNIFYYPIPTTSPLYQYYLDMVYKKPDKKTIAEAMDLAGVKEGYFVLNKYWWAFPKILNEAKFNADLWQEFGNGEVYVFKYKK